MKKLLAIASLAACSTGFAQNVYVAGSIGQSRVNIDKSSLDDELRSAGATNVQSSLKEHDTAFGIVLGYQFTPNVSAELGYADLGKAVYSVTFDGASGRAEAKVDGLVVSVLGFIPINNVFSIYGRLGVINASTKVTGTASGAGGSARLTGTERKTRAMYGAGVSYMLLPQLSLRVEYTRFDSLGIAPIGHADVSLASAGLAFKF